MLVARPRRPGRRSGTGASEIAAIDVRDEEIGGSDEEIGMRDEEIDVRDAERTLRHESSDVRPVPGLLEVERHR